MSTCDCLEELRMSSNKKGASETVKFLAAETNHVGRTMWGGSMVERSEIDWRH